MPENPNPFAAPQSEPTSAVADLPELHGRMPGSVMLAVGCVVVMIALNCLPLLWLLMLPGGATGGPTAFVLFTLLVGVLVLVGLIRRRRLARQWGRVLGLFFAVLLSIGLISGIAGLIMLMTTDEFGVFGADSDPIIGRSEFIISMLMSLLIYIIPAVLLWTLFFSLGRTTARQYFNLICPRCQGRRVKAANFFFTKAKCKECASVW